MKKVIISISVILLTVFTAQAQRSEGTATVDLAGRTLVGSIPRLSTSGIVEGTVVVSIKVNQEGDVVEAVAGAEGSTITNDSVLKAAKSAAGHAHFAWDPYASGLQSGTITYTFVSSGFVDTDDSVLKFMGIPIDGPADEMRYALSDKGFEMSYSDYMSGMFNGEPVEIYLSTNHQKVDVVKVVYSGYYAEDVTKVKYNTLLSRFNRNAKYVCVNPRIEVPVDEDIRFKTRSNTHYYDAVYFYLRPEVNSKQWVADFKKEYKKRFNRPLEGLSYEEMEEALFCLPMNVSAAVSGVVWFTMVAHSIKIYYVNLNNRPRGEDL